VDYNANALPDPGEPGLPEVKVVAGRTQSTVTDKDGYFMLPGVRASAEVRVSLDLDTVPAIYRPTHGTQKVVVLPRNLTRVDLGVAPAASLAGVVQAAVAGGEPRPLVGVRVFLTEAGKDLVAADSVTAANGSYFLGNLLPGRYVFHIDMKALPKGCVMEDPAMPVEIAPAHEPQDLKIPPFVAAASEAAPKPK
jgi:hypothetical protein